MSRGKRYTEEFKRSGGRSVTEVASRLGVCIKTAW
jgi:transposase-like protein